MTKDDYIDTHCTLVCKGCLENGWGERTKFVDYEGVYVQAHLEVKCVACGIVDGKLYPAMTMPDHLKAMSLS